mmetsp:Transcript_33836/g.40538  ORF Transcript_33836/g.40538 Transcript_33836/m.40538 type:complete len:109 (-) Transcript_33836:346-672(-)
MATTSSKIPTKADTNNHTTHKTTPITTTTPYQSRSPNPLNSAHILSETCFTWACPLLALGVTRPLDEADLPHIHKLETSVYNHVNIHTIWNTEMERMNTKATIGDGGT